MIAPDYPAIGRGVADGPDPPVVQTADGTSVLVVTLSAFFLLVAVALAVAWRTLSMGAP